jgi:hypothetical protein
MNLHKKFCIFLFRMFYILYVNISVNVFSIARSAKCIWQISNEVIEYQDLYRNKDHIWKKTNCEKIFSVNLKD